MIFPTILFYLFSAVLLISAMIAVSAKNTVHSVLFLILTFLNAAALFVLLGAEFLAMLLIIVYVGAIAVLFLFVVMMLNIDQKQIKTNLNKNLYLLSCIGVILFIEIILIIKASTVNLSADKMIRLVPTPLSISNTEALGNIIYTDFILPFEIAGMILFVAMIGAIVLTTGDQERLMRKQNISEQTARKNSIKLSKPNIGEGIDV